MMAVRSNTMVPHLALVTNRDVVKVRPPVISNNNIVYHYVQGEELCFNYGASAPGDQELNEDARRTQFFIKRKEKNLCSSRF